MCEITLVQLLTKTVTANIIVIYILINFNLFWTAARGKVGNGRGVGGRSQIPTRARLALCSCLLPCVFRPPLALSYNSLRLAIRSCPKCVDDEFREVLSVDCSIPVKQYKTECATETWLWNCGCKWRLWLCCTVWICTCGCDWVIF